MQGGEASMVSVVHQRPQQEAMGAKSSGGKVGRHNFVLHQPSGSSHSPLNLKGATKRRLAFLSDSLRPSDVKERAN